jgi:hypothetical protein
MDAKGRKVGAPRPPSGRIAHAVEVDEARERVASEWRVRCEGGMRRRGAAGRIRG